MTYLSLLLKGLGFGIMVSAPIGPLGILCIQRTLNKGFRSGFISGVGAATADILYAIVAGFGITLIANFVHNQQSAIHLIGGSVLMFMGIVIHQKSPKQIQSSLPKKSVSFLSDFLSSFLITITNPLTIIVFGIAFTSIGLNDASSHQSILFTLTGVFLGAILWWIFLSTLTKCFKGKLTDKFLKRINQITGVFVSCSGLIVVTYQLLKIIK